MKHKEAALSLHGLPPSERGPRSLQGLRQLKPPKSRALVSHLDVFVDVNLAFIVFSSKHERSNAADGQRAEEQLSHLKNSGRHDILPSYSLFRGLNGAILPVALS